MNKLLELLGQEMYDKLKEKLGEEFSKFKSNFEDGTLSEVDVKNKLTELELSVDGEDTNAEEDTKEEVDNVDSTTTVDDGVNSDNVDDNRVTTDMLDVSAVLADGWLLDGVVDIEKILYEPLKDYINGLNELVKQSDWMAKYKIAVLSEALMQNMYDVDDANRFINIDSLSMDNDGNVVGVKEAFAKLKADKPHLFKVAEKEINPIDNGFNPVDKVATSKPRSYAEAIEQTRALQ